MISRLVPVISLISFLAVPVLLTAVPELSYAQAKTSFTNPLPPGLTGENALKNVIVRLINFMLSVAVVLAVGALVWGGILYITSLGNDKRTQLAKTIIFSAIFGLVIIILALLLVQLVGGVLGVFDADVAPGSDPTQP